MVPVIRRYRFDKSDSAERSMEEILVMAEPSR